MPCTASCWATESLRACSRSMTRSSKTSITLEEFLDARLLFHETGQIPSDILKKSLHVVPVSEAHVVFVEFPRRTNCIFHLRVTVVHVHLFIQLLVGLELRLRTQKLPHVELAPNEPIEHSEGFRPRVGGEVASLHEFVETLCELVSHAT